VVTTSLNQRARRRSTVRLIRVGCDALALIGVAMGSVPLFLHGWVHVDVRFVPRAPSGSGVLSRLGADVDAQVAAIAAREVAAATSPTLWQYPSHLFQALFALLVLVAIGILIAPILSQQRRVIVRGCALLSSGAAAVLVGVAFFRVSARLDSLPARITEAMQSNALVKQALAAMESTPQVSGGPGWPLIIVAVGVALALIGTVVGLILALRRPGPPDILPRTREVPADRERGGGW
jgi:hypothetical protein